MSAIRVRTPGNNPETRIFCEMTDPSGAGCDRNINPPTSWDAREARKVAKSSGWGRVAGKDYCTAHMPSALKGASAA